VVLDVALPAHERAHLLPRGISIRVVVGDSLLGPKRLDAGHEPRPGDADGHGVGIVTVDAGDGVLDEGLALVVLHLARLAIWKAGDLLEALLDVAVAGEAIEGQVRGVALNAGPGLLLVGHAPGLFLVEERVVMA